MSKNVNGGKKGRREDKTKEIERERKKEEMEELTKGNGERGWKD